MRLHLLVTLAALLVAACDSAPSTDLNLQLTEDDGRSGFSAKLPEGTYAVTLSFGHATEATSTWVKAEGRRLVLDEVRTAPGEFVERTVLIHVRRPDIPGSDGVAITGSEPTSPTWDDRLNFEFSGTAPRVAALKIQPALNFTTVYVAGDSTVSDYNREPHAGWGQMLPRFFGPKATVANYARSGLALHTFEATRRLEKVLSTMKPGDHFLIQFGHNDQKDKTPGAGPFTTYKANLKRFIAATREKGGIPVLITPMERRRFQPDGTQLETLTDFAAAMRETGREENVPVIDLHAMSLTLYAALGPEVSKRAFLHLPAHSFPGQKEAMADDSHHSTYGAFELARCVVQGIQTKVPALAALLVADAGSFDPAQPDDPAAFRLPPSPPAASMEKPEGN